MSFGQRVKQYREAKGYTQEQLAQLIGVAKTTITGYERGNRAPDVEKIKKLAAALGVAGDDLLDTGITPQRFPIVSDEALHLARDYDGLDWHGRRMVRIVMDEEKARCTEQACAAPLEEPHGIIYTLPEFFVPMSAGTGQPAEDEWGEDLLLAKRPPRGASYVARISGNSMEPTYHNGDRLFVRAQTIIERGQVGVFFMDGKQWVKELGDGVLLSHNPAYVPIPMREDIRCQGLVLGVCDSSYFE